MSLNRAMKRTQDREKKELLEKNEALVKAALNQDISTRSEISKATGIKLWQLSEIFKNNLELYSEYTVRRRTLVDTAADNIHSIVMDKDNPNNYAASKYVLSKYKSDLDSILEASEEADVQLEIGGGSRESQANPIRISFRGRDKDSD